jgi:alanyl-tRNA synthetase
VRATGEIGLFRVVGESAIAAGIRRIEAISGMEAWRRAQDELQLLRSVSARVNTPVAELERKVEALLTQQKELEKQLKAFQMKQAAETASALLRKAGTGTVPFIVENLGRVDGDFLQNVAEALRAEFKGAAVLVGTGPDSVALAALVSAEHTGKVQAGKLIQAIAPLVGGKGGGKPDFARGGGKDPSRVDQALSKARELLGAA